MKSHSTEAQTNTVTAMKQANAAPGLADELRWQQSKLRFRHTMVRCRRDLLYFSVRRQGEPEGPRTFKRELG